MSEESVSSPGNQPELQTEAKRGKMLSADEYLTRRSQTLLDNPEAVLDESQEIESYFRTQDPEYIDRIMKTASENGVMNAECRTVVAIPAYNEGTRIKHTLEQYVHQSVDPSFFEIVVAIYPLDGDETGSEIAKFKAENPQVTITTVDLIPGTDEPVTVGLNRKFAGDLALARIRQRGASQQDTVLVFNDADTISLDESYLKNIADEFDNNVQLDALATATEIPTAAMSKPNVAAAFLVTNTFERRFSTGDVGDETEPIPEPALMGGTGTSSAARASIYAAVGGFNPLAVIGENWELGWLIADARGWDPDRIIYSDKTRLVTDPRRLLEAALQGSAADQGLLEFDTNLDLRQLDNNAVLNLIPDTLDIELLQDDVNSLWWSRLTGSNIRIGERRFMLLFNATMEEIGIKYGVDENSDIELVNIDGPLNRLSGGQKEIGLTHSQPRVYTPEMVERLRGTFATFPEGSMEARSRKAQAIAADIKAAEASGDTQRLPWLLNNYERFARHEYQAAA